MKSSFMRCAPLLRDSKGLEKDAGDHPRQRADEDIATIVAAQYQPRPGNGNGQDRHSGSGGQAAGHETAGVAL